MTVRDRALKALARQLGHPRGLFGRLVARRLNRGNRDMVAEAVDASGAGAGQVVADLGFGGGVGLGLLLEATSPNGQVHGLDISDEMIAGARRHYRGMVRSGRLVLHRVSGSSLPLPDSSLDALITVNTFYFVAELATLLAEIARVLRPGARLVVGVGDPIRMAEMPVTRHGFRLRPIDAIVAELEAVGMLAVEHRRIGTGDDEAHMLVAQRPLHQPNQAFDSGLPSS